MLSGTEEEGAVAVAVTFNLMHLHFNYSAKLIKYEKLRC